MDISLITASVYELPVSRRAGAIVYDGTADLSLWRPPGPDRELRFAYGETLEDALDKEGAQLEGGTLPLGEAVRLHPGKLRCDYLIWVATRSEHGETEQAPAPPLSMIERAAESALRLAGRHDTVRVAFGALGDGPGAAPVAERLAAIVRAADGFRKKSLEAGRASPVEEVFVCSPSVAEVAKAKRLVARIATAEAAPDPRATVPTRPARASRARKSSTSGKSPRSRAAAPRLDPADVSAARARADAYAPSKLYGEGQWLVHAKFGVGQVREVKGPERMIFVLFEDGEQRRLVHGR